MALYVEVATMLWKLITWENYDIWPWQHRILLLNKSLQTQVFGKYMYNFKKIQSCVRHKHHYTRIGLTLHPSLYNWVGILDVGLK